MKRKFLKLSKACLIITLMFSIKVTYATENINKTNESISKEYNPVTINYLLEGVDVHLKSSKTLDNEADFWDDYTVKLTNKLSNGSIDIQDKIREYYFSHYEVNGRRIESIDALITLNEEEPVINVIYSEDEQGDGYLRKGFKNGIAIDFSYIDYISNEESNIQSELYDEVWSIIFPSDYCLEIGDKYKNMVNANDKTLYLNVDTKPLSIKEETDLTKKYNYIDGIKIKSSLDYTDTTSSFILKYSPVDTVTNLKDKEMILNGINLEGKVEEIAVSIFENDSVSFTTNKNLNNYQFLFISVGAKEGLIEENTQSIPPSSQKEEDTAVKDDNINISNPDIVYVKSNEATIIKIILASFIVGSISTYILSLILSIRQENIEKKKEIKAQKEN